MSRRTLQKRLALASVSNNLPSTPPHCRIITNTGFHVVSTKPRRSERSNAFVLCSLCPLDTPTEHTLVVNAIEMAAAALRVKNEERTTIAEFLTVR